MIVLTDENVDEAIVRGLRDRGVMVRRAADVGLRETDDAVVFERAAAQGWVVFTHDRDFIALGRKHVEGGGIHAGIVYAHRDRVTVGACVKFVAALVRRDAAELRDRVHFVPWSRRPRR